MKGPERRREPRYPVLLELEIGIDDGPPRQARSRDLSQNGIFAELDLSAGGEMLPIDARVALAIRPEPDAEPIRVSGLVVHTLQGIGHGIQFVDVPPAERDRLAELVARLRDAEAAA